MTVREEDWGTESGLLPEFDFTVTDARFAYDDRYNNGQTCMLILEGVTEEGVEQTLMYSTGKQWEPADGGKRAVRENGETEGRRFTGSCAAGRLVTAAREVGAGEALQARGSQREAGVWVGLKFHMKRMSFGEGQYAAEVPVPVAFLSSGGTPATPPGPVSTAAPAASPNGADRMLELKLRKLAKECTTFDEFMERGIDLTEGNPAADVYLSDVQWYQAARG